LVWVVLAINLFSSPGEIKQSHTIIYCMPGGAASVASPAPELQFIPVDQTTSSEILATIPGNLLHWMIMVIAMMFPLLREPTRHCAFSVRRKDRHNSIIWFLTGYAILWAVAGLLFILLPPLVQSIIGQQPPLVNGLIKASGFLLAAVLSCLPTRPITMMKCHRTMPIRINGREMHRDSLLYGLKMGVGCLSICWPVMAALVIAGHDIVLMYTVTVMLLVERYWLPHTSRVPAYAWGAVALILFVAEIGF
jgi:predicted metal-binding membrane protein